MPDEGNKKKLGITQKQSYIPDAHPFEIDQKELITEKQLVQTVSQYIIAASFFVAYLDYGVRIGRYEDKKFILYDREELIPTYLQRLRVFNPQEELLLWRSGKEMKGRLRRDENVDDAKTVEVVEVHQALFGTRAKSQDNGNFTEIRENRGTRIILPYHISKIKVDDQQQRIWIKTHNYIDYIEKTGQATYTDCRFVSFTDGVKDL